MFDLGKNMKQDNLASDNRPVCFVISPFATAPADAGQRKRALQTTMLFKRAGYKVVFVLYAFEGAWLWGWDDGAVIEMKRQWDEVYIFPANNKVGALPLNGRNHSLDEWWDDSFGSWLSSVLRVRHVDVVVVHNVWLSKALSYFSPGTVKILDAHDLFYLRKELNASAAAEFFSPIPHDEFFGMDRADIVLAIQASEAEIMMNCVGSEVRYLPYDSGVNISRSESSRRQYIKQDRVRFGFIGNGSNFNKLGIGVLLSALQEILSLEPAPIELVLAGQVCDTLLDTHAHALRLGHIEDEESFYSSCDIILVPIFIGTGMKIKSVDALVRGVPALFSTHGAEGLPISPRYVFDTPRAMASAMRSIAFSRPSLEAMEVQMRAAYISHNFSAERRIGDLFSTIESKKRVIRINLIDIEGGHNFSHLAILALSAARCLNGWARVEVVSQVLTRMRLKEVLPPGCIVMEENGIEMVSGRNVQFFPDKDAEKLICNVNDDVFSLDSITNSAAWDPALEKFIKKSFFIEEGHSNMVERGLLGIREYKVVPRIEEWLYDQVAQVGEVSDSLIFELIADTDGVEKYTYVGILNAIFRRKVGRVYRRMSPSYGLTDLVLFNAAALCNVEIIDEVLGRIDNELVRRRMNEYEGRLIKYIKG